MLTKRQKTNLIASMKKRGFIAWTGDGGHIRGIRVDAIFSFGPYRPEPTKNDAGETVVHRIQTAVAIAADGRNAVVEIIPMEPDDVASIIDQVIRNEQERQKQVAGTRTVEYRPSKPI